MTSIVSETAPAGPTRPWPAERVELWPIEQLIPYAVFNWTGTLYRGSITFTAPMLYALSFLGPSTIGGLTGLFLATVPLPRCAPRRRRRNGSIKRSTTLAATWKTASRSVSSNSPTARLTQPCIGFCWSKRVSPIDQRSEDAGEPPRAEIGTDPSDRVRAIARRRTVSRLGRRAARNTLLGPGHASLRGDSRAHAKQHKAALRWASAITAVQAAANIALPVLKLPAMPGMLRIRGSRAAVRTLLAGAQGKAEPRSRHRGVGKGGEGRARQQACEPRRRRPIAVSRQSSSDRNRGP